MRDDSAREKGGLVAEFRRGRAASGHLECAPGEPPGVGLLDSELTPPAEPTTTSAGPSKQTGRGACWRRNGSRDEGSLGSPSTCTGFADARTELMRLALPQYFSKATSLWELSLEDFPADAKVEHVLRLACNVFGTALAAVVLGEGKAGSHVLVRAGEATVEKGGQEPWMRSLSAWCLRLAHNEILTIEDALEDPRLCDATWVAGPPHLRFFAGVALMASDARRLGALCLADTAPRECAALRPGIFAHMAELLVVELEAALERNRKAQEAASLLDAVDRFLEAFLFVNVTQPRWAIMHINEAAADLLGVSRQEAQRWLLWDLCDERATPKMDFQAHLEDVAMGLEFNLLSHRWHRGGGSADASISFTLRPATSEAVGTLLPQRSIPVDAVGASRPRYYFVEIRKDSHHATAATAAMLDVHYAAPFPGLALGPLLGRGSYGRVYRAAYGARNLAVKVIDGAEKSRTGEDGLLVEAKITAGLKHPSLVNTIAYAVTNHALAPSPATSAPQSTRGASGTGGGSDAGSGPASHASGSAAGRGPSGETWLLMDYCDRGSLQDAVAEKVFLDGGGRPDMVLILRTALQIAEGLAFLHSKDIVHGDLAGGNVLLTSSAATPHGFCAKVADFGLARSMDLATRIETNTIGTVTHMPPELLTQSIVSKATDVYAFGVLMWEMYSGSRAWPGLTFIQIIHAITSRSLAVPPGAPPAFASLLGACLARDAAGRPNFTDIVAALNEQLGAVGAAPTPAEPDSRRGSAAGLAAGPAVDEAGSRSGSGAEPLKRHGSGLADTLSEA